MRRTYVQSVMLIVLAVLALMVVGGVAPRGQTKAELALKAAMDKEVVDGDLKAAIEMYRQIAKAGDRAVAARALVRMGQCYEKLGDAQARKAYEQVVREYGDQADVAAEARTRLAALAGTAGAASGSTMAVRRVWAGPDADGSGSVSPDGKYLSFADWKTYNLGIRELATGTIRILAKTVNGEHYGGSVISPDGKQIVYRWLNGRLSELRVVGVDGSNPRLLSRLDEQAERMEVRPDAWSPDGKHVLVLFAKRDKLQEIALVAVADGSMRVLKTLDPPAPQRMRFSQDGRYVAYDFPQKAGSDARDISLIPTDGGRDVPLVQHPASDTVLGWTPDGRGLLFASDRTRTWDAWLVPVEAGRPQGPPVLVRTGIGEIAPMGFAQKGSFYYGVSTDLADVFTATLDLTTGSVLSAPTPIARRLGGNYAPDWSPDGKSLAYVSRPTSKPGSHAIVIRSVETGEQRELLPKMNRLGYNLRWSPDSKSMLVRGYDTQDRMGVYTINLQTGDVIAAMPGAYWADWSRDGKAVLCATNARNSRPIVARDLDTGQDKELFSGWAGLSLAVSPDGQWVAFSSIEPDLQNPTTEWSAATLRIMPVTGGEARQVLRLERPEDFAAIAWAADGRRLLFVRRNLKENTFELWHIRTEGGEPQRILVGLALGSLCQISMHPDGRRIALNAGSSRTEIWVMENFLPPAGAQNVKK